MCHVFGARYNFSKFLKTCKKLPGEKRNQQVAGIYLGGGVLYRLAGILKRLFF